MPALRSVRRSRRLSDQFIDGAADLGWDYESELVHPGPEAKSVPPSFQLVLPSSPDSVDLPSSTLTFPPGSSHSRKRKEGHIPRPPNAFIVFRSFVWDQVKLHGTERDNRNISRLAGDFWRAMIGPQKAPFIELAAKKKIEHAKLYPDYKYTPTYRKMSNGRIRRDSKGDVERCNKVTSLLMQGVLDDALRNAVEKFDEGEMTPTENLVAGPLPSPPISSPETIAASRPFPLVTSMTPQAMHPLTQNKSTKKTATPMPIAIPQVLSIPELATQRFKKPPQHCRRSGITKQYKSSPKRVVRTTALPQLQPEPALVKIESMPSPALATPELSYSLAIDDLVPTADIPPLDLDDSGHQVEDKKDEYDYSILPRSTAPAYGDTYFGVKTEAHKFVDGCILGTYNHDLNDDMLLISTPALSYESSYSGSESGTPPMTPPTDHPLFTNPFNTSSSFLGKWPTPSDLDHLFGKFVSPTSVLPPTSHMAITESVPEELDLSMWLNYDCT